MGKKSRGNMSNFSRFAIAVFGCGSCCFAMAEETPLIHEIMDEQLEKIFGTSNLTTHGNVDSAMLVGHEHNKTFDPYVSVLGDAFITYKNNKHKIGYGAEVGFKIRSGVVKGGRAIVDTAHLRFSHDLCGTVKIGYTESAAYLFNSHSRNILTGYKSFECSAKGLEYFYDLPKGAISNGAPDFDNKSAKIVWLSPTYKGFSVGISYAPDGRFQNPFKVRHVKDNDEINAKLNFDSSTDFYKNETTVAVAYEYGLPDSFNFRLSGEYWFGTASSHLRNRNIHNLSAYNIGLDVGYDKLQASFNFTDNGKSGLANRYAADQDFVFDANHTYNIVDPEVGIRSGADAGKVYRAVVGYSWDKLKMSAGYLYSKVKMSHNEDTHHQVVTAAVEYDFDRMVGAYIEYDHMSTHLSDRSKIYNKCVHKKGYNNDHANIFIVGVKINI